MADTAKAMAALANFPKVMESARFLAAVGVLREEDVMKCCRVFLKKHPEIERVTSGAIQETVRAIQNSGTRP